MSDSLVVAAVLTLPVVFGFVSTALATWPLIGWLKRRQLGKTFREDGPSHQDKAGTPTMGGLALVGLVVLASVAVGVRWFQRILSFGASFHMFRGYEITEFAAVMLFRVLVTMLVATAAFGAIGLFDDWRGLARKGRAREIGVGLTARQALLLQGVFAVVVAYSLAAVGADAPQFPGWDSRLSAPSALAAMAFLSKWLPQPSTVVSSFGLVAWIVVAALVIVGTVNGVNLSDGLDGLAAGLGATAFLALGLIIFRIFRVTQTSSWQFNSSEDLRSIWTEYFPSMWTIALAAICLFIAGACLGFLVHNRYPARVFMGNVTSMALGGALATIALATGTWPLLPVIGVVYVAEVLSDIIQIGYFKWSGGKRVFRMAPLHHHFELGGMHETAVTRRFWLAGAIGAAVAVGFVYYATWGV